VTPIDDYHWMGPPDRPAGGAVPVPTGSSRASIT